MQAKEILTSKKGVEEKNHLGISSESFMLLRASLHNLPFKMDPMNIAKLPLTAMAAQNIKYKWQGSSQPFAKTACTVKHDYCTAKIKQLPHKHLGGCHQTEHLPTKGAEGRQRERHRLHSTWALSLSDISSACLQPGFVWKENKHLLIKRPVC